MLILKRNPDARCTERNNVLFEGRHVGRIYKAISHAPREAPWFWGFEIHEWQGSEASMEKSKKKGPTQGPRTSKLIAPTWQRSRLWCGPLEALRQGCDMRAETLIKTTNADGPIVRAVLVGAWRSPVSAPVWGTGGRGFKSRRPDHLNN